MIARRELLVGWGAVLTASALGLGVRAALATEPRRFGLSVAGAAGEVVPAALRAGTELGRQVDVVNFFQAWEWQQGFPHEMVRAARDAGATPQITWEPWDPRAGGTQPRYELGSLAAFDEYVDGFASALAAVGTEVNIRFGHEMNNDWFPWSALANGNRPADYVAAFRRLHDRVDAAGGTNARWTWSPNVVTGDRFDLLARCYPGDDVVDVVSLDGYDQDNSLTPEELFGPTIAAVRDIAPGKALWINETGCAPGPHKARWIQDLFAYLATTPVETVMWFELQAPDRPDWRLLETPASARAARTALQAW